MGFRLHSTRGAVLPVGGHAGVSFRNVHNAGVTHTALSNTTHGGWSARLYLDNARAD